MEVPPHLSVSHTYLAHRVTHISIGLSTGFSQLNPIQVPQSHFLRPPSMMSELHHSLDAMYAASQSGSATPSMTSDRESSSSANQSNPLKKMRS